MKKFLTVLAIVVLLIFNILIVVWGYKVLGEKVVGNSIAALGKFTSY